MTKIINKKINFYLCMLFFVCTISFNFFYLVDTSTFSLLGLKYLDLVFIFSVIFVFFFCILNMRKFNYRILLFFLSFILIAFCSALSAYFSFNQSLFDGLICQRYWLSSLLLFFPFYSFLKDKKITIKQVYFTLYIFATIFLMICTIQYLVGESFVFTYTINVGNIRYDSVRYYFEFSLMCLIGCLAVSDYVKTRKIRYLFLCFWILFFTAAILKTRMITFAYLLIVLLELLCSKANFKWKFINIIIFFVCVFFFLTTSIGTDIARYLFLNQNGANDTMLIRTMGREFYFGILLSSPFKFIFGEGIANPNNLYALSINGTANSIFIEDNGIFGIFFQYGFFGVMLNVSLYSFLLIRSFKQYKVSKNNGYYLFLFFEIISCLTIIPSIWKNYTTFIILAALIEIEYEQVMVKKI